MYGCGMHGRDTNTLGSQMYAEKSVIYDIYGRNTDILGFQMYAEKTVISSAYI